MKRAVWLVLFLSAIFLAGTAMGAFPVPATTGSFSVPAITAPSITGVTIVGDQITIAYEGEFEDCSAHFEVETDYGEDYVLVDLIKENGILRGTIPDMEQYTSCTLYHITMGTPVSSYYAAFNYNASGVFENTDLDDNNLPVAYGIDNQGRINSFYDYSNRIYAYYDESGNLDGYTLDTEDGYEDYDANGVLTYTYSYNSATGESTYTNYSNGQITSYTIEDDEGSSTKYTTGGKVVSRASYGDDGYYNTEYYNAAGVIVRTTRSLNGLEETFDAEGELVSRYYYDDATGNGYFETYENGVVTTRREDNINPDGTGYADYYVNGVYESRDVYLDGRTETYDAAGKLTNVSVYNHNETLKYDGEGNLLRRTVYDGTGSKAYDSQGNLLEYSVEDGDVWINYDAQNVLKSLSFYDDVYYDYYFYDAKEGQWYLNDVEYDGPAPVDIKKYVLPLKAEYTWYPNNTVCSFGPQFRDVDPKLTDLWYMFTPIDLSKDGTQTFELVGGSVYVLGTVSVTVSGDKVVVDYSTIKGKYGHIYIKSEYLNFFPDLASVKTVVPEEIGGGFAFGQEISIAKDLKGDTNVLMFVRNEATFRDYVTDDIKLRRFYKNYPGRRELREEMLVIMD